MYILKLVLSSYRSTKFKAVTEKSIQSDISIKVMASLLLSAVSTMLTVFNIIRQYWFMMVTTLILAMGYAVSAILCDKYKKRDAATVIMSVLSGLIFTVYAISGENEGFSILWTLLVPPISMSLIGLNAGTLLCAYFQVFLIVLFYTPLNRFVADYYTVTFQHRFPVLFFTSFAVTMLLSVQKEYYYQRTEYMAYTDALTGLYNRHYYDEIKEQILKKNELSKLTLVCIDINRLKYANDNYGHDAGNDIISSIAECMRASFGEDAVICRMGGDEFTVVSFDGASEVREQIDKLKRLANEWKGKKISGISLSVGAVSSSDYPEYSLTELEKVADAALYIEKDAFYQKNGIGRR